MSRSFINCSGPEEALAVSEYLKFIDNLSYRVYGTGLVTADIDEETKMTLQLKFPKLNLHRIPRKK